MHLSSPGRQTPQIKFYSSFRSKETLQGINGAGLGVWVEEEGIAKILKDLAEHSNTPYVAKTRAKCHLVGPFVILNTFKHCEKEQRPNILFLGLPFTTKTPISQHKDNVLFFFFFSAKILFLIFFSFFSQHILFFLEQWHFNSPTLVLHHHFIQYIIIALLGPKDKGRDITVLSSR